MKQPRYLQVNAAYARIVDLFLRLKAEGYDTTVLADAIARAARETAIEGIK